MYTGVFEPLPMRRRPLKRCFTQRQGAPRTALMRPFRAAVVLGVQRDADRKDGLVAEIAKDDNFLKGASGLRAAVLAEEVENGAAKGLRLVPMQRMRRPGKGLRPAMGKCLLLRRHQGRRGQQIVLARQR